jgi:hypothetical protein
VVVSATLIAGRGGRCGEARDMSVSDRDRAGAFRTFIAADSLERFF